MRQQEREAERDLRQGDRERGTDRDEAGRQREVRGERYRQR